MIGHPSIRPGWEVSGGASHIEMDICSQSSQTPQQEEVRQGSISSPEAAEQKPPRKTVTASAETMRWHSSSSPGQPLSAA